MKLLCVDDNVALRKMIDDMVSPRGLDIDFATNGREAVEAYEFGEYDAILMDLQMPVMSGIEATREIRQIETGFHLGHTPILFLTGADDDQALEAAQVVGGDGHLMKPFTSEALFSALDDVLHMPPPSVFVGDMASHI